MPPRHRALELLAVAALCAAAFLLVRDHQRMDSPTLDEPYHVFAASEYVEDGAFWLNMEHPPLVKLVAGVSLRPLGLESPDRRRPRRETPHPEFLRFVYANRAPADAIVDAARRPMPWFLVALVLVTWLGGRAFFGVGAGLLAAALVALDPGLVGHAGLVHTDVPAAAAMSGALLLAMGAARKGRPALWLAAGAALGLALATKFTAVLLAPLFVVLPLLARKEAPLRRNLAWAGAALALSGVVLAGVYEAAMRRMDGDAAERAVRWYLGARGATPASIERHAALSRALPPLAHWTAGLTGVGLYSRTTRGWNYFRGRTYEGPDLLYFPAAFVLKSTPAFLLLLLLGALAGRRHLLRFPAAALLLAAALVFASAMASAFNIGQRHLFPAYPLLVVAAAGALAARLDRRRFAACTAGLVLLAGISLARVHPNEIAYFNSLAGGVDGGGRWLSDSNVDWGQDMKRLAVWLRATGGEERTTVVAYSGLATNYFSRRVAVLEPDTEPAPGRYVVGRTLEALGPRSDAFFPEPEMRRSLTRLLDALRARGRRVGRIGGSLIVWELPAAGEAPRPGAAPPR